MRIKKLKPGVWDIFLGNGWMNWTRVRRNKEHGIEIVGGAGLNRDTINHVKERLSK